MALAWYERHRWMHLPLGTKLLLGVGYLMISVCVVVDFMTGPTTALSPALVAVPVLAAVRARNLWTPLAAGALAIVLVFALAVTDTGVPKVVHVTAASCALLSAAITSAVVALLHREMRAAARLHRITEAVQRALLRPMPPRIGRLQVAVRYVAAEPDARIGGDLYDILETKFGVRVLLGDVCGKGLETLEAASDILGVFRDAARTEPGLDGVATRLDGAIARRDQSNRFATAILVAHAPEDDNTATIVNCGHPPPLLCHQGAVTEVSSQVASPPLGLLELTDAHYSPQKVRFQPGDLLLLFTDGTSEARNGHGDFYPIVERFGSMGEDEPGTLLDRMLDDLHAWTGDRISDDVALMALRCMSGEQPIRPTLMTSDLDEARVRREVVRGHGPEDLANGSLRGAYSGGWRGWRNFCRSDTILCPVVGYVGYPARPTHLAVNLPDNRVVMSRRLRARVRHQVAVALVASAPGLPAVTSGGTMYTTCNRGVLAEVLAATVGGATVTVIWVRKLGNFRKLRTRSNCPPFGLLFLGAVRPRGIDYEHVQPW
ncbi:PP2C family protein-serine/threonine phosphatase [Streptomyces sp. NPDC046984]|uniref:PP2C family protein-serine/threonine phosphatase n=1 Tax=Streptomyces sp. NPDC046984 TaxID=3155138 RepID=UPI00340CC94A